jgi:hypothetical protein
MYYNNLIKIGYYEGIIPDVSNIILKEHILKTKQPYLKETPMDGTRYEDETFPTHPEFDKIIKHLRNQWMFRFKEALVCIDYWAHIHDKNMSTLTHHHVNKKDYEDIYHMSGVYYVQVPKDSGQLVLEYPINQFTRGQYYLTPEPFKFYLFPSSMSHHVTRNHSDVQRISIAMNFELRKNPIRVLNEN